MHRSRPVLYITMVLAGLAGLLPATVILWLLLVQAVGGRLARRLPLADGDAAVRPMTKGGRQLRALPPR